MSTNVYADGVEPSTITIVLRDTNNHAMSGVVPVIEATGTGNTVSACSMTTILGASTCTVRSTVAESKTIKIVSPVEKTAATAAVFVPPLATNLANPFMIATGESATLNATGGAGTLTYSVIQDTANTFNTQTHVIHPLTTGRSEHLTIRVADAASHHLDFVADVRAFELLDWVTSGRRAAPASHTMAVTSIGGTIVTGGDKGSGLAFLREFPRGSAPTEYPFSGLGDASFEAFVTAADGQDVYAIARGSTNMLIARRGTAAPFWTEQHPLTDCEPGYVVSGVALPTGTVMVACGTRVVRISPSGSAELSLSGIGDPGSSSAAYIGKSGGDVWVADRTLEYIAGAWNSRVHFYVSTDDGLSFSPRPDTISTDPNVDFGNIILGPHGRPAWRIAETSEIVLLEIDASGLSWNRSVELHSDAYLQYVHRLVHTPRGEIYADPNGVITLIQNGTGTQIGGDQGFLNAVTYVPETQELVVVGLGGACQSPPDDDRCNGRVSTMSLDPAGARATSAFTDAAPVNIPRGGGVMTINGTGFSAETTVNIADSACAPVTTDSPELLHCTAPTHEAGAFPVIVRRTVDGYIAVGPDVTFSDWREGSSLGAPSPRGANQGVAMNGKAVFWGGYDGTTNFSDGGVYDPSIEMWTAIPSGPISGASTFAAGAEVFGWGSSYGQPNYAFLFDPTNGEVRTTNPTDAPTSTHAPAGVWTGADAILWGGFDSSSGFVNTGAVYTQAVDTWRPMINPSPLSVRSRTFHVWTGSKMLVWGGFDGNGPLGDGAAYEPITDTWTPFAASIMPPPSSGSAACTAWDGSHMLVYTGAQLYMYDPADDAWIEAPSTSPVPAARTEHTCLSVPTGFFVFGGKVGGSATSDAALYVPGQTKWVAIDTTGLPALTYASAAWTGSIVLFGGYDENSVPQNRVWIYSP